MNIFRWIMVVAMLYLPVKATMAKNNHMNNEATIQKKNDQVRELHPAYVHVVCFWLKNPESKSDRAKFEASLKRFMKASKYAKTRFIGKPPKAVREVVDDSFTYSLVLSFESAQAQELYQKEEAHTRFVTECKDLWSKVIVYDSEGIE